MITTINNKNKKPNVPNKREQNQTCLDSAEREGLRPKGNVPNLRFPEFQGEWEKCTFDKIAQYKKGPFGSALKKDIFVPQSKDTIKVYEQQNAIKKRLDFKQILHHKRLLQFAYETICRQSR